MLPSHKHEDMSLNAVRLFIGLFILSLLTACVSTKIQLSDNNRLDPRLHKTFAWEFEPIEKSGRNRGYYNIDRYLRKYVQQELIERGYQLVARDIADVLIEYQLTQTVSPDRGGMISPRDEMNAAWDTGMDVNNTAIYNHYVPAEIKHASLALEIDEAKSGELLWRVTASKIIENDASDAAAMNKSIQRVVAKMLHSLPAQQ